MNIFQGLEAFVRVAQTKSYPEAARILRVSKSVISTRIKSLEDSVKTPLLNRNTRTITLTEAGKDYYPECEELVNRVKGLVTSIRDRSEKPYGALRIHALPGFILEHFGELLGIFQQKYPDISLELVISDAVIDPIRENYDCVLQIFEPVSEELISKRLCSWRGIFCATPEYLEKYGTPSHPEELKNHRLGLYSRYPWRDNWQFTQNGEVLDPIKLTPSMQSNSVHLLKEFAHTNAGIVCIPTYIAASDLISGRLQAVITNYEMPTVWLCAVYPVAQRGQLKLKLFLDELENIPGDTPPWDQALIDKGLICA